MRDSSQTSAQALPKLPLKDGTQAQLREPSSGRSPEVFSLATHRRGELAERQQRLGAILVTLKKMAEEARAVR